MEIRKLISEKVNRIGCKDNSVGKSFTCRNLFLLQMIFVLVFISHNSLAQMFGGTPTTPVSNCSILPAANVCPNSVVTYTATANMTSYSWSITGNGTIIGAANTRTLSVRAGGGCNTTYKLTVVTTSLSGSSTCSKIIQIVDNIPPTLTAASDKTVASGSQNIIFDNPTMSDNCGTPVLNVVSTTSTTLPNGWSTYTRTWKATDICGNTSTCSQTITVAGALLCAITGDNFVCQGSTSELCAPPGASSYAWSTGATSQCITISAGGNYTVTISDGEGTSSSCSKVISSGTPIGCLINGNSTICSGASTELCAPQGAASYLWSTGATTSCITVNAAGTYSVSITEANGCVSTCSKSVTVSTDQDCMITGNSSLCSGGTTNLCAPAGASSYLWNTGQTSQCITVTSAGSYSVTITNPDGCSKTCTKVVSSNNTPSASISGELLICPGSTSQLCATPGMQSYAWSTGATTACITVSAMGTYSCVLTNSSGCTASVSQNVDASNASTCTITGNSTICPGGSTTLCAPSNVIAYQWSEGSTTQCIEVTAPGTYTVIVTNSSGCTSSCTKTITSVPPIACAITGATSICQGENTELCAPAGASAYLWSDGSTGQCINVSASGNYSVTLTNSAGCTSTCLKTVTVKPLPVSSITGNTTICAGGYTNLCAPTGYSYVWSTGVTTKCINVNSAGTYTVTIKDNNGCTSSSSKSVTVNSQMACSITGNNFICHGGSTVLCAPAGASSYAWNNGATTQCITVTTGGTYSVNIVDANGCMNSCSKSVSVISPQVCSVTGPNALCAGASGTLCVNVDATSYLWNTGATTKCITIQAPGNYSVTTTDANGCLNTCSKTIATYMTPTCTINGNASFCAGGSTTLCGPAGTLTYLWSTGATTQCINVNSAGTYTLTITSSYGCTSSSSKTVTIQDAPSCSITGNLLICEGNSTQLCATPGMQSYLWSNGSTNQCLTVNASGSYSVKVTSSNGCTSTCSQNIDILTRPQSSITGSSTICAGGSTAICAQPGGAVYSWNTGQTSQCINVSSSATYTVTITGVNGCTNTASKVVNVNTPQTCTISGTSTICAGASTTLCASAATGSYAWSNESTSQCITVSSPGVYSVITTDASGCISSCSKTVVVNPLPVCSITGSNETCQGVSNVFTANGGSSYLWNTGATTSSISVNNSGNYSVTVTNSNGCTSTCSRSLVAHNCGITLKKTPNICEFPQGTPTNVNFKYVIKNTGDYYNASGTLTDDNGTPLITTDDINVCSWGPVAPGDSIICNRAFTLTNTHTNVAKASGTSGNANVSSQSTATVTGINCTCNLNYPDNSNLPRSAVIFNESEILRTSDPGPSTCGSTGSVIKMWYNDEHALLLGVRQVNVKTFSGITTTNYTVSPSPAGYGCISNPLVGDTISSGDQAANDLAAGGGRPLWPALFITDLTVNGPTSRIGDWQQGGKGIQPTKVCGTWKAAVKTIDKTKNPPLVTITNDMNPPKNNWNLGAGSHVPPGGFASLDDEGYGAEISWDVNSLGLIPGHTYRLVFMVHDGDQNKTGGDVGEACTTIHIPEADCVPAPLTTSKICYTGNTNKNLKVSQQWTLNPSANEATIRTTLTKSFADNTYGTNAIGWPSGHTFSQMVSSDNLQMSLYDANNVKKMEFVIDYLSSSNTVPSGYKTLGVSGGEGSIIMGNASDILSVTTSMDKNLNSYGYQLTSNSPLTNANYSPNASYPNWIYEVWYEVKVKLSAFGTAGFGRPKIASINATPNKTGNSMELVIDTVCTQSSPRIAAPDSPSRINAIAYPNPFGESISINFITPGDEEANVIITDLAGRVVESFRHEPGIIKTGDKLPPGIYFVTITQGDYYKTIKIVKSAGTK